MNKFRAFFIKLRTKLTRQKFKVVYDNDVVTLLTSLKIYDKIMMGEIKCLICNQTITVENFAYLQMKNGDLQLVCNNSECMCQKK